MELQRTGLFRRFGSTALSVASAQRRNSFCASIAPHRTSNSPPHPASGPHRLAQSGCPRLPIHDAGGVHFRRHTGLVGAGEIEGRNDRPKMIDGVARCI
jgi:hypothetical protein